MREIPEPDLSSVKHYGMRDAEWSDMPEQPESGVVGDLDCLPRETANGCDNHHFVLTVRSPLYAVGLMEL